MASRVLESSGTTRKAGETVLYFYTLWLPGDSDRLWQMTCLFMEEQNISILRDPPGASNLQCYNQWLSSPCKYTVVRCFCFQPSLQTQQRTDVFNLEASGNKLGA